MPPIPPEQQAPIERAAALIAQAQALVIAAGAGMGVDSGLPDFRGNNGFWRAYPALAAGQVSFEEAASAGHFIEHPRRAWGFYGHRLQLYRRTQPHAGFALLKGWADAMPLGYFVYTSNVDGQFQQAGFAAERIFECHGSIHGLQCTHHCSGHIWPASGFTPQVDEAQCLLQNDLPHCPHCGGIARPNILMFNDWAWNSQRSDQQQARLQRWLDGLGSQGDAMARTVVIELGAGRALPAVRSFSARLQAQGAALIRINLNEAQVGQTGHVELGMGALEALGRIQQLLPPHSQDRKS